MKRGLPISTYPPKGEGKIKPRVHIYIAYYKQKGAEGRATKKVTGQLPW